MGRVARGARCILEDDRHQGLADGRFPAPGALSPLPTGPSWGPARRLAHEVGGVGGDDLEAVWVGAWWHKAEVPGRLHSEDLRQWDFLAGHRASAGEGTAQGLPCPPFKNTQNSVSVGKDLVCMIW